MTRAGPNSSEDADDEQPRVLPDGGTRDQAPPAADDSVPELEGDDVAVGEYTWADYEREYLDNGSADRAEALGFPPEQLRSRVTDGAAAADELEQLLGRRTVNVNGELDEDLFFSDVEGRPTLVDRYDLEKAVPVPKKEHFEEIERYWVNKPFAFVVLFRSRKENELKYYVVEPHLGHLESELQSVLSEKLRDSIKYSREIGRDEDHPAERARVIENQTRELLSRYNLYVPRYDGRGSETSLAATLKRFLGMTDPVEEVEPAPVGEDMYARTTSGVPSGLAARPSDAFADVDDPKLTEYQVEKLLYYLKRDFVGYERIDPIKRDVNVEDISCDGYNSSVFVYHSDHEQVVSNVAHGEAQLDDFVVKLAQRSGKGISKRQPQVDATLPDGSRAQLTLGREVSDRGTNYTIRQFKDVPFTPIDLVNWRTFSLEQMAFLWLCIENHRSIIIAGGTASGKTTSLNAVSLFIPSNTKIVSIEDTREMELPQSNWVASVTRPSFAEDGRGDVDEFDLLEAALRQRPDYLLMGEVRGEEGRTLFQMMSTGHTTYTTFHADSVGEVIDRFTTDPINVSKTMFTALDLVSIQTQTRVQGRKVRRNRTLTEVTDYDSERGEIIVQDLYEWRANTDETVRLTRPSTLDDIKFDRGWDEEELERELFERRVVLSYLVDRGITSYARVAATIQGFINAPDTILALMAQDRLVDALDDLRDMETVLIDIDPEKEEMVPRPEPDPERAELAADVLAEAEDRLFEEYRSMDPDGIATALPDAESEEFDWNTSGGRTAFGEADAGATEPLLTPEAFDELSWQEVQSFASDHGISTQGKDREALRVELTGQGRGNGD